jgi:REP element-mobilizing transposase RayT
MPRYKRIREPGLLHHVMSRGNGRMPIFLEDGDYRKFLSILADVLDEHDVDCWDACLMPNHYHLAVMNRQASLPEAMRHLNGEYGTWWNARHGRVGHVFQGRYKDQIVQCESYLLNLIRYIALNPVRAGLVESPELWPWSTYRCTAGLSPRPGFLCCEPVLAAFGEGAPQVLRDRYARHVTSAIAAEHESYQRFRSRQRILGDRSFKMLVRKKMPRATDDATVVTGHVVGGFR